MNLPPGFDVIGMETQIEERLIWVKTIPTCMVWEICHGYDVW